MKRTPLIFIFLFSLQSLFSQVNIQDSLALVALYNSCNGTNWNNNENWLSGPVSSWHGIILTQDRVSDINLTENNITGDLPIEFNNLTELINLSLNHNQLNSISNVGGCTNLIHLNVSANQLNDIGFSEFLINISELFLEENNITDLAPLLNNPNAANINVIFIRQNPLSSDAINVQIPALESLGIEVLYDIPNPDPHSIYISPGGNDGTGNGNIENPLKTIEVALGAASTGDTIVLLPGNYSTEYLNINHTNLTICSEYEFSKDTTDIANTKITSTNGGITVLGSVKFIGLNFNNCYTDAHGAAIKTGWAQGELTAENCYFIGNKAGGTGGAIVIFGENTKATIHKCVFKYNEAIVGSAIQVNWGALVSISNCLFFQNLVYENGTISCWDSEMSVTNCTLIDNITNGNSSGLFFYDYDSPEYTAIANIKNSIFYNRNGANFVYNKQAPIVEYSCVKSGFQGEGNIDIVPNFVSEDDFHLRNYSGCLNTGTPDTTGLNIGPFDLDDEQRIQDGRIDMGCYEGGEESWPIEDMVTIPDPSLREKLCEEFNCTPNQLSKAMMETLEKFWPMDCVPPIMDLSGLELCTNLTSLAIDGNEVSDLAPISGLTNLKELWLDRNKITSLISLQNLSNLEKLSFSYNDIYAMDDLGPKPKLTSLYAMYTQIEDLTPIQNYPSLEILILSGTLLDNLYDIQNMPNLWALVSRHSSMSNAGSFSNCPKLTVLFLAYNNFSNIDFLYGLNLERFEIPYNNVSDLSPISSQTNLWQTSLHDNPISDISPLASLSSLKLCWVENCLISNIDPIAINDSIYDLRLSGNNISDLLPLLSLPNLDSLRITDNFLSNKTIADNYSTLRAGLLKIDEEQSISDLRFKYPNAITGVNPGKTIEISWEDYGGTGLAHRINLDYSTDGGSSWTPILTNAINDSSHMWTIPDLGGTAFMLKIEDAELPMLVRDTSELVSFCNLSAQFTSLKSDLDFTFTNTSTGTSNEYYWDFGDGVSTILENPIHSYSLAGILDVCLTTMDNLTGCTSSVCSEIEAGTVACNADFDTASIADTRDFTFTDNSTGLIETWYWDFGDNTSSNAQNPSHMYSKDGTYEVCLTVRNNATGYISTECINLSVTTTPELIPPLASFAQIIDDENLTIKLINTSTGDVTNWHWTFGDGSFFDGQETSYTFDEYGSYTICLFASNEDAGLNSSICKELKIGNPPCILQANFSKIIDNSTNTLHLNDESSADANAWYWNFGDAVTSTSQNPTHTYSQAGKYIISLTTQNSETGCADFISSEIMVGEVECIAGFTYGIDISRRKVSFAEQTAGSSDIYYWDFGDGSTSTSLNPEHTYAEPGIYTVSLTVSDNAGLCMDQSSQEIQIQQVECSANFIFFIDSTTMNITLSEQVIGEYTSLLWELGDGYSSTLESYSHAFSDPGYYTIGLTTFNENNGCMDHKEEIVLISAPGVDVYASYIYTVDDASNTVTFLNTSEGDNGTYLWDFGDDQSSSDTNPVHTYFTGGFYSVSLTAFGDGDKQDTRYKSIPVNLSDNTNCLSHFYYMVDSANLKVNFFDNSLGDPTSWLWEFENSGISEVQNPVNYWSTSGYYIVHLRSTNTFTGCFSDVYKLMNVGEESNGLQTKFDYTVAPPTNKKSGYPVNFVGATIGDLNKFNWDFGDGQMNNTSLTPTNYFSDYGIYEVCFTIEDPNTGATATYCENVALIEPQEPIGVKEYKTPELGIGDPIQLNAYPNPFRDYVNIMLSLPETEHINLTIYDLSGRSVYIMLNTRKEAGTYKLQWDGARLMPGIYFMVATTKNERKIVKIVKN